MIENFHDASNTNDDILFFDKDFSKAVFFADQMGILGVDLDKTNLDDYYNFADDDPETVIHVRFLAWHDKFEKHKTLKKRQMKN